MCSRESLLGAWIDPWLCTLVDKTLVVVKFWLKHEVYFIFCLALLEPYTMTATTITSCSKPRSQEE
jgi:hypothetical protein